MARWARPRTLGVRVGGGAFLGIAAVLLLVAPQVSASPPPTVVLTPPYKGSAGAWVWGSDDLGKGCGLNGYVVSDLHFSKKTGAGSDIQSAEAYPCQSWVSEVHSAVVYLEYNGTKFTVRTNGTYQFEFNWTFNYKLNVTTVCAGGNNTAEAWARFAVWGYVYDYTTKRYFSPAEYSKEIKLKDVVGQTSQSFNQFATMTLVETVQLNSTSTYAVETNVEAITYTNVYGPAGSSTAPAADMAFAMIGFPAYMTIYPTTVNLNSITY
jgi:hypothetical protein